MRLETEFRLCLQRQTLEQMWRTAPNRPSLGTAASSTQPTIAPSTWVRLLSLPTAYCSDEALLICQQSEQQWLAWIPDYGEITLEHGEFEL